MSVTVVNPISGGRGTVAEGAQPSGLCCWPMLSSPGSLVAHQVPTTEGALQSKTPTNPLGCVVGAASHRTACCVVWLPATAPSETGMCCALLWPGPPQPERAWPQASGPLQKVCLRSGASTMGHSSPSNLGPAQSRSLSPSLQGGKAHRGGILVAPCLAGPEADYPKRQCDMR